MSNEEYGVPCARGWKSDVMGGFGTRSVCERVHVCLSVDMFWSVCQSVYLCVYVFLCVCMQMW